MGETKRGLYTKYVIFKRVPCTCGADRHCQKCEGRGFFMDPVEPEAEYFVLRIDEDDWHGEASRVALAVYATMAGRKNCNLAGDVRKWLEKYARGLELGLLNAGRAAHDKFLRFKESDVGRVCQGEDVPHA